MTLVNHPKVVSFKGIPNGAFPFCSFPSSRTDLKFCFLKRKATWASRRRCTTQTCWSFCWRCSFCFAWHGRSVSDIFVYNSLASKAILSSCSPRKECEQRRQTRRVPHLLGACLSKPFGFPNQCSSPPKQTCCKGS